MFPCDDCVHLKDGQYDYDCAECSHFFVSHFEAKALKKSCENCSMLMCDDYQNETGMCSFWTPILTDFI